MLETKPKMLCKKYKKQTRKQENKYNTQKRHTNKTQLQTK